MRVRAAFRLDRRSAEACVLRRGGSAAEIEFARSRFPTHRAATQSKAEPSGSGFGVIDTRSAHWRHWNPARGRRSRCGDEVTPSNLADMLDRTGVRHKIVIISACYSGVFIPRLAEADTLVITAADANHSSFGCRDKAKWTYFGDAFFNVALRRAKSLNDAFLLARSCDGGQDPCAGHGIRPAAGQHSGALNRHARVRWAISG
jgi:Peptidase C13 family